jgi:hypothetical protein
MLPRVHKLPPALTICICLWSGSAGAQATVVPLDCVPPSPTYQPVQELRFLGYIDSCENGRWVRHPHYELVTRLVQQNAMLNTSKTASIGSPSVPSSPIGWKQILHRG